jgi:hypothetical protein
MHSTDPERRADLAAQTARLLGINARSANDEGAGAIVGDLEARRLARAVAELLGAAAPEARAVANPAVREALDEMRHLASRCTATLERALAGSTLLLAALTPAPAATPGLGGRRLALIERRVAGGERCLAVFTGIDRVRHYALERRHHALPMPIHEIAELVRTLGYTGVVLDLGHPDALSLGQREFARVATPRH